MRQIEDMILSEGTVLPGGILKVGSFLNQRIDPGLLKAMASDVAEKFGDSGVTKVMTIESSGIALAAAVGMELAVPIVFVKKHKSSNVDGDVYSIPVHSFTHGNEYEAVVSKDYLLSSDRVLLVDDFLASGNALTGLVELVRKARAELVGAAVAIEKRFQGGGDALRDAGIRVYPLACIESMDGDEIKFCDVEV